MMSQSVFYPFYQVQRVVRCPTGSCKASHIEFYKNVPPCIKTTILILRVLWWTTPPLHHILPYKHDVRFKHCCKALLLELIRPPSCCKGPKKVTKIIQESGRFHWPRFAEFLPTAQFHQAQGFYFQAQAFGNQYVLSKFARFKAST